MGAFTPPQKSDIYGSIMIGIIDMATRYTSKFRLRFPVFSTGVPALTTSLAGIRRIDDLNRNPGQSSLVFDKASQLKERPSMHSGSFRFPGLHPLSDSLDGSRFTTNSPWRMLTSFHTLDLITIRTQDLIFVLGTKSDDRFIQPPLIVTFCLAFNRTITGNMVNLKGSHIGVVTAANTATAKCHNSLSFPFGSITPVCFSISRKIGIPVFLFTSQSPGVMQNRIAITSSFAFSLQFLAICSIIFLISSQFRFIVHDIIMVNFLCNVKGNLVSRDVNRKKRTAEAIRLKPEVSASLLQEDWK